MKILYVTTISNTVNAFLIPHIKMLIDQGHFVDVAFNPVQEIKSDIDNMGCKVHTLSFDRSPLKKQNFVAYKKLKKLIQIEQYDLIHTHTPVASACVRLACKNEKNLKVLYTAHGFHFYKGGPLKNWLLYYLLERWLSKHTDVLLTINNEDYLRAKNSFKARKVKYIPGVGLDTKKINECNIDVLKKREEFGLPENAFVLLSVGELNRNKNHETVIKAVAALNNPNVYYVICGEGNLRTDLERLIDSYGIADKVKLVGFRKDVHDIYKISNAFIFPSYREGLSVSLMDSMAIGIPVICSKIRGNNDLIDDNKGGFLVEPDNVEGFKEAINVILENPDISRRFIVENNKKIKEFELENVLNCIKETYSQVL